MQGQTRSEAISNGQNVRQALEQISTIRVLAMARNSTELIAALETAAADVLVTDYSMPGGEYGDGVVLLDFIKRRFPDLHIVVVTMLDGPLVLKPLLRLGIRCILSKSDDASYLVPAIHVASAGGSYYSPSVAPLAQFLTQEIERGRVANDLTKRELEILRYYASGLSINDIAALLNRSKQTISSQRTSAMKKLGIERDADLLKYAIDEGLVSSPDGKPA